MTTITEEFSEPPIPPGHKASGWVSWGQIQVAASMLDVNKEYSVGENFAVRAHLKKKIARGEVQQWKQGPHQQSPAYYRTIWK
jgi:hypothetical protein